MNPHHYSFTVYEVYLPIKVNLSELVYIII